MSTYAVFGMTRPRAIEMARRSVSTSKKDPADPRLVIDLSSSEWEAAVQERATAIMASKQCVRLSEFYDAPHFAFDYLRLAKAQVESRTLHVQSYAKTGEKDPKTGKDVFEWKVVAEPRGERCAAQE